MRTIQATRYVTPLREGGSLPAIVEADDEGMYVLKFRGAGQGAKALVAELIAGELARACGLPMPEIVFAQLDPELARTEPDPEIQDLIRASAGLNLAIDFLPGAATFDPVVDRVDPLLASKVVWFDAWLGNVDRTARNSNLLMWHGQLHLIDHGAAIYMHHNWGGHLQRAGDRFERIADHVLLPFASALAQADADMLAAVSPELLVGIVGQVPTDWLADDGYFPDAQSQRRAYVDYLLRRLGAPRAFVEEAIRAHAAAV